MTAKSVSRAVLLAALSMAGACSSVAMPERATYRLAPPEPAASAVTERGSGVLRVASVELAADLQGDRLMVADGPVRVHGYQFHHWAGPLDRMIADSVVTVLRRSGRFTTVKAETDRGEEDWLLNARVLDFHQAADGDRWCGLVTLDLQVTDRDGRGVFRGEIRQREPLAVIDPEHLAVALSAATAGALDRFLAEWPLDGPPPVSSTDSAAPPR
jgi:uncharacterized lipoprotein YmbA